MNQLKHYSYKLTMDTIKQNIKNRKEELKHYSNIIININNEINKLEKEMYLLCDHKFKEELITSGPYRDYGYSCIHCGYTTKYMI